MNRRLIGTVATAFAFWSVQSCSEGSSAEDITGIALNEDAADESRVATATVRLVRSSLEVGDTTRAIAVLRDAAGRRLTRIVVWSSSDASIATVSASGLVTAISAGVAAIIVTRGTKIGRATLTVTDSTPPPLTPVASVTVSLPVSSLNPGGTTQAEATTRDSSNNILTDRPIVWSSSDVNVATISGSGMITARVDGVTDITAASEGKVGTASLSVTTSAPPPPSPVASVSVSPETSSLQIGATVQLSVTARDANNNVLTGRIVTASSANTAIATVNATLLVTAVSAGTTQITVVSEGKSAVATITVTAPAPIPVASVSISPATPSLQVGAAVQLTATTRDASNNVLTGRVVTWASANSALASVSSTGRVTAVAAGTTQITATSEGKSASATVTITTPTPAAVASVSVALANGSLNPGSTTQATATTRDANNNVLTGRAITWSSGNTAVATVSATGLVAAVAVGTAQITAASEGQSGGASLVVEVAGSSNEPSGMTVVSDRSFNALHELGWDEPSNGGTRGAIVSDATAPKSPSNILRMTLPAGFGGGSASYDGDSPGFSRKTLYISWWSRISSNWQGHNGSGVNKQFYVYTTSDVPSVYVDLHGSGSGTLTLQVAGQNISAGGAGYGDPGNPDWTPNLGVSATIVRGQWFRGELLLTMNTQGAANGAVDWWLNGVKVGHIGGVMFQSSSPSWRLVHYANVWGGGGGTVTNTMWMDFDHLYISGK